MEEQHGSNNEETTGNCCVEAYRNSNCCNPLAGCCQKLKYDAGCLNSGSAREAQGVCNQCPSNSIPPDPIEDLSKGGASGCKRAGEIDVAVLFQLSKLSVIILGESTFTDHLEKVVQVLEDDG